MKDFCGLTEYGDCPKCSAICGHTVEVGHASALWFEYGPAPIVLDLLMFVCWVNNLKEEE